MSSNKKPNAVGPDKLASMEKTINESNQRNLTGSLEHCKEELRDAYMNFKDL